MKTLCLFVCLFSSFLAADEALYDTLTLQVMPGMQDYQIRNIATLNPHFALATHQNGILRWDGTTWNEFEPSLPLKLSKISGKEKLYPLSPDNIFLFSQPEDRFYHTLILHFNGRNWRFLPSPNPSTLEAISFLDSHHFYAGGGGNNLIYYDGQTARTIQTPPGDHIKFVKAFSKNHLIAVMEATFFTFNQNQMQPGYDVLLKYNNGQWHKLAKMDRVLSSYFYSADSGILVLKNNQISRYARGQVIPITNLTGMNYIGSYKDHFYFYKKNILYDYTQSNLKPVYQIEKSRNWDYQIYPINPDEFFLLDHGFNLYYLGRRQWGIPVKESRIKFHFTDILNDLDNDTFGKSLYRNQNGGIDIYLTVAWRTNIFFTQKHNNNALAFEDVIINRGLAGYQTINTGPDMSDSGLFFADIDNDGDQDAVLTAFQGKSQIYENIGNDQFQKVTKDYGFELAGRINHVSWGDINSDGNLDFAVGDEYGLLKFYLGDSFFNFQAVIFHPEMSDSLNAYMPWLADLDNDGNLDVMAHSWSAPLKVFENMGSIDDRSFPKFADRSALSPEMTEPFDYYTQSLGIGDYDNDGDLDLFLANRRSPLKLFRNDGDFHFTDVSATAGFGQHFLAYGGNWRDLDQDGWLDLFVTTLGCNYIFWNNQGESFTIDSLSLAGKNNDYSAGAVIADFDNDNDLDILVANAYLGRTGIYENLIGTKQPLKIEIRGSRSNRFGLGSRLWVYDAGHAGEQSYLRGFRQITTHVSYIGSALPEVEFYLSPKNQYDLVAALPSGEEIRKLDVSSNQHLILKETQTLATHLAETRHWLISFYKHPGRRPYTWRFAFFASILIAVNLWLWRRSLWQIEQTAFFNLAVFVVLLGSWFFLDWKSHFLWVLWIFTVVAAGVITIIQYGLYKQRSSADPLPLYEVLRQFTHGKGGMKQLDRMLFLCNNLSQDASYKMLTRAGDDARLFQQNTLPLLQEVLRHSRRAVVSATAYHNLHQYTKVGERVGRLFSQNGRLPSQRDLKQSAGSLKLLKKELNTIRSQVEGIISCNLPETLHQSLSHFREFTDIALHYPPEINQCVVTIPRSILADIFNNIFQNALQAMQDQDKRDIQITIEFPDEKYAAVTICDAGPGIPKHLHDRIFEDGFSTKGSTGLGLHHARKFLEQFGGSIELLNNPLGEGACFQLTVKVKQ